MSTNAFRDFSGGFDDLESAIRYLENKPVPKPKPIRRYYVNESSSPRENNKRKRESSPTVVAFNYMDDVDEDSSPGVTYGDDARDKAVQEFMKKEKWRNSRRHQEMLREQGIAPAKLDFGKTKTPKKSSRSKKKSHPKKKESPVKQKSKRRKQAQDNESEDEEEKAFEYIGSPQFDESMFTP